MGAIQVASSTQNTQTPFFIAACDYVLIGEEFYAASAYLTRVPVLVGSLVGQDWCKILIAISVVVGAVVNTADFGPFHHKDITMERKGGKMVPTKLLGSQTEGARPIGMADTTMAHLFKPQPPSDLKVQRPKDPDAAEDGGGE